MIEHLLDARNASVRTGDVGRLYFRAGPITSPAPAGALRGGFGFGYAKNEIRQDILRRFDFVDFAKIHFISALHGTGVGNLYGSVHKAYLSAFKKITTSKLNQTLERITTSHAPPNINGRRVKLRYAHIGGHNPPIFVIHGKQAEKLPSHYVRFLEKNFRKLLRLEGTPVRIQLRDDDNPFTQGEEDLNYRQVARKRRIQKNRESRARK